MTTTDRPAPFSFAVRAEEEGQRLDKLVVAHLQGGGRRGVSALFAEGRVRADGRVARKGDRPKQGQVIVVDVNDAPHVVAEPDSPLTVKLETEEVVVVEKPPSMATAPRTRGETGTLSNALLARYPELSGIGYGPFEPGILHRLDNGTSGLVLAARTARAWSHLRQALSEGRLEKRYLAVVTRTSGATSGAITADLEPDPRDPRRVAVVSSPGEPAARRRTEWTLERTTPAGDLLEVRVTRAYRHQIRVHLASKGMPLVGDVLYGGPVSPPLPAGRHALHASYVAWAGDAVVPSFRVESPLPRDLAALFSD